MVWFGDGGTDNKTAGQAGGGRVKKTGVTIMERIRNDRGCLRWSYQEKRIVHGCSEEGHTEDWRMFDRVRWRRTPEESSGKKMMLFLLHYFCTILHAGLAEHKQLKPAETAPLLTAGTISSSSRVFLIPCVFALRKYPQSRNHLQMR